MFQQDKDQKAVNPKQENSDEVATPPLKPFSKKSSHTPEVPPRPVPSHPRRIVDIPGTRQTGEPCRSDKSERRELLVGRDTCISDEITSCDKLVVDGQLEVSLSDTRAIEISPSGFFKGSAEVEEADISGRFEGELVAREKLIVRSGGRVSGSIRYRHIVIESGGEISGEMQTLIQTEKAESELKEKEKKKGSQSAEKK